MVKEFDYEKIKYIKMEGKNTSDSICVTTLSLRNILEKKIILYCENRDNTNIKCPQKVYLKFVCNDGLYVAYTELTEVRTGDALCYFTVQKPLNYEYQQKREYFRINRKINCCVKFLTESENKIIQAQANNISANGISIIMPDEYANQLLNLTIRLDNCEVHTLIRYIRSEKLKNGYLVSFKYENISTKDRDIIAKYCIKQQLQERKEH